MTATIDGIVVAGTPDEIVKLIKKLREPKVTITGGSFSIPSYNPKNGIVLC